MPNTPEEKKKLLARARRLKGQVEALERSLSDGSVIECRAILQQTAAVRGAANGLMAQVLESHLRESIADTAYSKELQQCVDDTVDMVRTYLK